MTAFKPSLAVAAALLLSLGQGPALAVPPDHPGAAAPIAFASLSSADQKIAHALFLAQQPTAEGPPVLSLDQIAAIGGGGNWRAAFARMKRDGLVHVRSLAQVVSGDEHRLRPHSIAARNHGRVILMSGGNGQVIAALPDRRPARTETADLDQTDEAQAGGGLTVAAAAPHGDSAAAHP